MATKYNFKEEMNKPERLAPGHRMCAGCGGGCGGGCGCGAPVKHKK